jgi:predicted ArsR family transcriptional regulator
MGEGASRNTRRRLTIDQAADQLGITVDAVRGRVKRGTITHEHTRLATRAEHDGQRGPGWG